MRTILFLLAFSPALLAQPLSADFLVLGPFPFENAENMQAAFDEEILLSEQAGAVKEGQEFAHEDKTYQWQRISATDSYFDLDADGNVTHLVLDQGGMKQKAIKK